MTLKRRDLQPEYVNLRIAKGEARTVGPKQKSLRRKLLFTFFRQNWTIGISNHPIENVAGLSGQLKQSIALDSIIWMGEKRGEFRADPFPIIHQGQDSIRIFHEAYDWSAGRGRIDYVDFSADAGFGEPVASLVSPRHLSYPFIFENDGVTGYIPEHSSMREVAFFPLDEDGLPKDKIEMMSNSDLIDSTIVRKDGILWLFATRSGFSENSELHIYYADTLRGPWLGHEANPVKIDVRTARPAGPAFFYQNSLFRPSQDCTDYYGSAIIINEVELLNKCSFRERAVSEIRLESGSRYDFGMHTLSSAGEFTICDGARLESKIHPVLNGAQHILR